MKARVASDVTSILLWNDDPVKNRVEMAMIRCHKLFSFGNPASGVKLKR